MSNIDVVRKNLGPVTAYKYAVQQGYTGTEQEFAALMASYGTVAQEAAESATAAEESATAAAESASEAAESARTLTIDSTLTQPGQAADAKVVGDDINKRFALATGQAVGIPANSDLDDYVTVGNYRVNTVAISKTIANIPVQMSGRLMALTIQDAGTVFQIYITAGGTIFTRIKSAGVWNEWKNITGTTDTTLSISGTPADAKATGDEFDAIADSLSNTEFVFRTREVVWEQGSMSPSTGEETETDNVIRTGYLKFDDYPVTINASDGYNVGARVFNNDFSFSRNIIPADSQTFSNPNYYIRLVVMHDSTSVPTSPSEASAAIASGMEGAHQILPSRKLDDNINAARNAVNALEGRVADLETGADISELKEDLNPIIARLDIYDSETDISYNGAYVNSLGWYEYNQAWAVTKKLPIRKGINYYYKGLTDVGGSDPVTVYFDINNNVVGYFKQSTGINQLIVPSGATSIAFSVKTGDISKLEVYGIYDESLTEVIESLSSNVIFTNKTNNDINALYLKMPTNPDLQIFNARNASVMNARISSINTLVEDYRNGYFVIIYPYPVKANTTYTAKLFGTDITIDGIRLASANAVALTSTMIDVSTDNTATASTLNTTQAADYFVLEANINMGGVYDVLQGLVIIESDAEPSEYHQYYANVDNIINPIKSNVSILNDKTSTAMKHEQVATLEDCAWSWWMYPQAIAHHGSKNFAAIGEINSVGIAGIATVNLDTYKELKIQMWQSDIDDHNGMAIIEKPNELFVVAAAKHGAENKLHLWRTMNRGWFSRMDREVVIDFGAPVTYCQMFNSPDNKIVLFVRVNNKAWYACYSTDSYGQSWESPFEVITADRQYYCMFRPSTDSGWLNVAMYSNPNISSGTDTRIRFAKYNISERKLYDANGNVLSSQGNPVTYTDVPIVINIPNYSASGTLRNRLLDLAITAPGQYAILYVRFNNASDGVYHANLNGTDYTLPNGGGCFYTPSCYYPGAVFVPKNTNIIYLCRYTSNRYKLERYELENGSYVYKELIDQSEIDGLNYPVARPVIDINGEILFYQKGATLLDSFTRYNYDAMYKELT